MEHGKLGGYNVNGKTSLHLARSSFRHFVELLDRWRYRYTAVAFFTAFNAAVEGVCHPLLIKYIFDSAMARESFAQFIVLVIGYLVLGLYLNVASYCISLWQTRTDNEILRAVSAKMLLSYYRSDYRTILEEGEGSYISKIRSDVKDGLAPMLILVRDVAKQLALLIALMSVLIFISVKIFLILFAIIPISVAVSRVIGKTIRSFTTVERDDEAAVMSSLGKAVSAFKLVRFFSLADITVRSFDEKMHAVLASGYQRKKSIRMLQGANDLTMVFSDFFSMLVGAIFVFRQQITLGSYIAFMNSFWRSTSALMEIFRQSGEFQSNGVIIERIHAFLNAPHAREDFVQDESLVLDKVSYSFDGVSTIPALSISMQPGMSLVLTGANGSGKTTFANIMAGLLHPLTGRVFRPNNVSVLTLPLFFPHVRVRELPLDLEILERFGLSGEVVMDSFGEDLSAGQKQKLGIALALTKKAELYILDEPMANLDMQSKHVVLDEIFRRTAEHMLVVVMHGTPEEYMRFSKEVSLDELTGDRAGSPREAVEVVSAGQSL